MRLTGFYTTYITLYNYYTNSNIPIDTKTPTKLYETVSSVGRLYNFTKDDYIACIHYCYNSNPLGYDDLRLYGAIQNYVRVIPHFANANKPKTHTDTSNELDNLWTTL
jgi:hypothetical protein